MAFLDETGLAELWSLTKDCVNWYVWEKGTTAVVDTGDYQSLSSPTALLTGISSSLTIYYSASFSFDGTTISLVDPQSATITSSTDMSFLAGKYLTSGRKTTTCTDFLYYCTPGSYGSWSSTTLNWYGLQKVTNIRKEQKWNVVGYVNSADPNAYPINDGYTYVPMGQLGEKTRIATGSYTGTGTYGSSNPNSLTFDFEPKVVFMTGRDPSAYVETQPKVTGGIVYWGVTTTMYANGTDDSAKSTITYSGNTMRWYCASGYGGYCQLNESGRVYHYIAIG